MTSELERIKILEGKVVKLVEYLNKVIAENSVLKQKIRDLQAVKKDYEAQSTKFSQLDAQLKELEQEREEIRAKVDALIAQIDELGI
ncbi:MAG: hypothetical protein B5M54_01480 [Candidatus Aminicenantes bacterium 4484_214]|nr:MAG: hypothetical protein B5M54_01480 [Candidatus Aminicenantes bacterium 4484_214]RLE09201.1 MAG: hypothetical protein DRJ06_03310 [Candidatus Aminicenantes bacterium]HDJ24323.1 hypothetical protein [Candidatus Aminicenantes bacterium]